MAELFGVDRGTSRAECLSADTLIETKRARYMTTTFADLGVSSALTEALEARGITEPFSIQEIAIPDALAGRDVCGTVSYTHLTLPTKA